jgi:hypothetical protein
VRFISSASSNPVAQTVLQRTLYEELHALRGLRPAGTEADADLVLLAKIASYDTIAASYNALDQVREYRLSVTLELALQRPGETAPLWKGRLQATQVFPAGDLALQRNAENAALNAVARTIAQKLLTAVERDY